MLPYCVLMKIQLQTGTMDRVLHKYNIRMTELTKNDRLSVMWEYL